METFVTLSLRVLAFYLEVGLGWAVWFHFWGLRRVDPGIEGAGLLFRLLITPGLVALWPLMAARCLGTTKNRKTLGGSDSPVPAHALRSIHFRLAQILLLLLPLAVGLALTLRPSTSPDRAESPPGVPASIPDPLSSTTPVPKAPPLVLALEGQRPELAGEATSLRCDFLGNEASSFLPTAVEKGAAGQLSPSTLSTDARLQLPTRSRR